MGGNKSQIDYVLCRRHKEFRMKNCKVIPGKACLTKHRFLWAEVVIKGRKKRVWNTGEKKIKAWKLKDPIKRRMFEERVSDRNERANDDHGGFSNALLNSTREVYGETTGRRQRERETWWWNDKVQLAVREKKHLRGGKVKEPRKCTSSTEKKNRHAIRTVAIAKDRVWKYWSESFQSNEGIKKCLESLKSD